MECWFCIKSGDQPRKCHLTSSEGSFVIEERANWTARNGALGLTWTLEEDRHDCSECKHRLTCLLDHECDRTFESR